jgi:hypothetical protein
MVEGKQVRLKFDPANAPRAHKDSNATEAHVGLRVPGRWRVAVSGDNHTGLRLRLHPLSLRGCRSLGSWYGGEGARAGFVVIEVDHSAP